MDLGESLADTAVRETQEETGIHCRGHRAGRHLHRPRARHPLHQRRRGTPRVLRRVHRPPDQRHADHQQRVSPRSEWVDPGAVEGLRMDRSMRIRVAALPVRPAHALPRLTASLMLSADWLSVYVEAAAAIGTIGAFTVGLVLLRREHRREEHRAEDERRAQAVKVSAWVEAQRTPRAAASCCSTCTTPATCRSTRSRCPARTRAATRPSSSASCRRGRPSSVRRRGNGCPPTTRPNRSRSSSSTAAAASGAATNRASSPGRRRRLTRSAGSASVHAASRNALTSSTCARRFGAAREMDRCTTCSAG